MKNVENRPIGCQFCGAMVTGRESSTIVGNRVLKECRWTCPRCGRLARVEEEYDETTVYPQDI